jgi:hypothetical protein
VCYEGLNCPQTALEPLNCDKTAIEVLRGECEDFADPESVNVLEREEQPVKLGVLTGDLQDCQEFTLFEMVHFSPFR